MARSLVDVLSSHASARPDTTAYRFMTTGERDGDVEELTYARLGRRARAIGAHLQERGLSGSRAMLLYPPGVEFVSGFMGCLSAGVIAVPSVPPQGRVQNLRTLSRMRRMIADADVKVILATRQVLAGLESVSGQHFPELSSMTCVATEEIPDTAGDSWREPELAPDSVAFLQYTSGSTSAPRGVMVTHGNLMHNQLALTERMGHTPEVLERWDGELYVSWLPLYHDLGLITPVLNNLYVGGTSTLFSPLHFLQQPERWLDAISHYRPHTSGGPNFAYELCLRRATPELLDRLDLSRWRVALNGAEPVRATTMRRFADAFAAAGFRRESHFPCYGLAEATLMVTGSSVDRAPTLVDRSEVGSMSGTVKDRELVSSGRPGIGITVVIADPERHAECPEGEVGEIWVAGESVTHGYWRNVRATREVFRASLTDGRGGFLRTGDLGFMRDGEVFVTGRLKDLLVIGGRNHYPQDLELTVEMADPGVRPGCIAAFSVDDDTAGEQPVVVAEVAQEAAHRSDEIEAAIRGAVGEAHGLSLRDVVLIGRGTIAKTSSGKIQRKATRAAYLEGTLSAIDRTALAAGTAAQ
ncbi:fatty acyl-AMP ligase [Streptomyces sp. NBC_00094]|uniref:fatty acyl-AMP ligase n=1 Tax=Streptomyces sp. NBC_00094 TaxID=2903620 RepID=UPI00224E098A|nr:fatty acyl-AMP ligase [Streptomyces sp. NBC_00094]MCX5394396.1 fatty acyl-AMP ligase [Streptomyces sp. NBC_00094]